VSLSSMLADAGSPLRRFLAVELPEMAAVRADCRARLPSDPDVRRPSPPPGVRPALGTLGAAIDHRLRLALSDRAPLRGTVRAGVALVAASAGSARIGTALQLAGNDLLLEAAALVTGLRPFDTAVVLGAAAEERLARVCVVAVWFEEVYRSRRIFPGTALGEAGESVTLEDLLAAVPEYVVADVVAVLGLAGGVVDEVRALCGSADVEVGPVFAGSSDVGGADADWIAGGLLVDVKATATPAKLRGADIQQLACYVLLDYDDFYSIERVGWYFARIGVLVAWDVGSFFRLLGAVHPIGELRQGLAAALAA
jgi:hypothetical protein